MDVTAEITTDVRQERTEVGATVTSIAVKPDDQVAAGELVLSIEP